MLASAAVMTAPVQTPPKASNPSTWLWLAGIMLVGFIVRVVWLGEPSLSHPEAFIPGLDLPPDISWPEPRHGLFKTLHWHFYYEPHPVLYYASMWAWTEIFGTSTFALRFPSVLLGTGSIAIVFLLADRVYERRVAWIAAGMLALHGFHIYWSGNARMYVPAGFFALLSTLVLVEIARRPRPGWKLSLGYVAALTAALHSTELAWVVWAMHFGWVVLTGAEGQTRLRNIFESWRNWRVPNLAGLQAIVFMLGLPELGHSLYQSRHVKGLDTNFLFFRQYFTFGFLLEGDGFSLPMRIFPTPLEVSVFLFATGLIFLGVRVRAKGDEPSPQIVNFRLEWLLGVAASITAVMLMMTAVASRKRAILLALASFPLLSLVLPLLAALFRPQLARHLSPVDGLLKRSGRYLTPITLLGVVAPVLLFILSFAVTILASRAFLVFVPFVLILSAAAIVSITRRAVAIPIGVVVTGLFVWMCGHGMQRPNSPRDYRTLSVRILAEAQPGDLLFVRNKNWADTPLMYYMGAMPIVGENYTEALSDVAAPRVWVPYWPRINDPSPKIDAALVGLSPVKKVVTRRGHAVLYASPEQPGSPATLPEDAP